MTAINPIFSIAIIILLGYLLSYYKIVKLETAGHLITYVFWIAIPSIVFSSISQMNLYHLLAWKFIIAYPLNTVTMMLITFLIFRYFFKEKFSSCINYSYLASIKNTIMLGYPILFSLLGKQSVIPMTITVIFFNCLFTPILIYLYESKNLEGSHCATFSSIKNIIKNPLIISAFFGILFSIFKIPLPTIISNVFSYINPSFFPCTMLAIGIELSHFKFNGNPVKILTLSAINLLLNPIIAIFISYIFRLSTFYSVSLLIFSSLPSAKSVYVYAKKYHVNEKETAAIILFTTLVSLISIPFFIYISHLLWKTAFK